MNLADEEQNLETVEEKKFYSNSLNDLNYERDISLNCSSTCSVNVSWGRLCVTPGFMRHEDSL